VVNWPAALRTLPKPWVFTNGVFDVLHRGHVMYLAQARALGGSLIVALEYRTLRSSALGEADDRPLNRDEDRAVVMASQESVSLVTWFDEDTPQEIIAEIRPDILVKGGDYDMSKLPETRLVESWGGHALALPFVQGYSTTQLVNRNTRKLSRQPNTAVHSASPASRSVRAWSSSSWVGSSLSRARCWIMAQRPVGAGGCVAHRRAGSRPAVLARCSSAMLPTLARKLRVPGGSAPARRYCTTNSTSTMPPRAVLDVKLSASHRVCSAHLGRAWCHDLLAQRSRIARRW